MPAPGEAEEVPQEVPQEVAATRLQGMARRRSYARYRRWVDQERRRDEEIAARAAAGRTIALALHAAARRRQQRRREAEELPEEEAPDAPEAPSVADEFSELCDALRDKYGMPDGDWKALLDKGMALYARIPEGALSFEAVRIVTNDSALTAADVIRRDLDPILRRLEEGLRNGVSKEEDAGSKKPEREIGADEGAAWAAELMRNVVLHRIDLFLADIGERGNPRPATRRLAEAATARLAERAAALRESPRPHPAVLQRREVAAAALE